MHWQALLRWRKLRLLLIPTAITSIFYSFSVFTQHSTHDIPITNHNHHTTSHSPPHSSRRVEQTPTRTKKPSDFPSHDWRPDGKVFVNPDAPHPVFQLIQRGEEEWNGKLQRASKTLEEAVVEYQRRYKRLPPKGFDDWWDYAQTNNVQLPDEYDFIYRDLEPFWGINPADLLALQAAQEDIPDSYTLAKSGDSPVSIVKTSFREPELVESRGLLLGAEDIMDLLDPVEPYLPQFRIVVSPHDNPNLLSDYFIKNATLEAAASKTFVDLSNLPKPINEGWVSACPPTSPARLQGIKTNPSERPGPPTHKSFIYDHRLSMDPCLHPSLFYDHAQFLNHPYGHAPEPTIVAQFSYCSTMLHHDIQAPSFMAWVDDILPRENDPEWDDKSDERLSWRGSNTGINHNDNERWREAQRPHLMQWANELEGNVTVLMPTEREDEEVGEEVVLRKALINPAVMDIAFTGEPIACDPSYCEFLSTVFEWRRRQDANGREAGNHKYVVDVDGNGWSSRFKRLITSNSLIFKATLYPEWWLDRIQPWVHYIPVQVDYSDVYDAFLFFRGGLYGEDAHDDLARKIAKAGRTWSRTFWRQEDMTAYFFRLLLEYSRIMSLDRDAMSYSVS